MTFRIKFKAQASQNKKSEGVCGQEEAKPGVVLKIE